MIENYLEIYELTLLFYIFDLILSALFSSKSCQ